jgi:hypothetical protein
MPVRLHHIVGGAHDLPRLAWFWTQALGWKALSEREPEIIIGIDEHAIFVQENRSRVGAAVAVAEDPLVLPGLAEFAEVTVDDPPSQLVRVAAPRPASPG